MTKSILALLIVSANAIAQSSNESRQQRWQQFQQEFQASCGSDLQSLCGGENGRAKFKCLRAPANAPSLSEQCSTFLESHPRHHGKNKPTD